MRPFHVKMHTVIEPEEEEVWVNLLFIYASPWKRKPHSMPAFPSFGLEIKACWELKGHTKSRNESSGWDVAFEQLYLLESDCQISLEQFRSLHLTTVSISLDRGGRRSNVTFSAFRPCTFPLSTSCLLLQQKRPMQRKNVPEEVKV